MYLTHRHRQMMIMMTTIISRRVTAPITMPTSVPVSASASTAENPSETSYKSNIQYEVILIQTKYVKVNIILRTVRNSATTLQPSKKRQYGLALATVTATMHNNNITRCSAIEERPRCRVRYSFRQK